MKESRVLVALCMMIALLTLVAAGTGLLAMGGDGSFEFVTLRGEMAQIHGQGLYYYDTLFTGAGNRGVDLTLLVIALPILILSLLNYRRGSLRGGLALTGILGYWLYAYASSCFATAYNPLFMVYVALFSLCFFAFIIAFTAIDQADLVARFSDRMPRKGLAVFMFVSGAATLFIWASPLVTGLITGETPALLDTYTTFTTYALDLALITPLTFICGSLVLKKRGLGYLIAMPLMMTIIVLLPQIVFQTIFQVRAGVALSPGQIIGPISGFALLGAVAIWLMVLVLRNVRETTRL